MNSKLDDMETIFLFPEEEYKSIHASLIRDIASRGRRLKGFVPEAIEAKVFERLS